MFYVCKVLTNMITQKDLLELLIHSTQAYPEPNSGYVASVRQVMIQPRKARQVEGPTLYTPGIQRRQKAAASCNWSSSSVVFWPKCPLDQSQVHTSTTKIVSGEGCVFLKSLSYSPT